jgi:hypothetical protein
MRDRLSHVLHLLMKQPAQAEHADA